MNGDAGDIVRFIRARVDEDEHVAREAADCPGPGWSHALYEDYPGVYISKIECEDDHFARVDYEEAAEHIARQDPGRVLRQCAMIRAMMRHAEAARVVDDLADYDRGTTAYDGQKIDDVMYRDIAALWSTHPDYREEWKVDA
ncbi:hypothetical protein IU501_15075 [Nocardia otitidiscaviarum]|uniref:DUF6221 family protein n=1 Tax=Nocardia otitidiscaviarum TaxID=1823 RepID=UPI0018955CA5|nr:DUF6221 family protein [Nocardia otitidiscaviarum]MBF6134318.1 hypothetical protein [Nocardia otitidiscaviarum]